jgi:hypothetical protein
LLRGSEACLASCLAALVAVLTPWSAKGAAPKRVVLLHSYGRGFEPYTTFSENFRTELATQLGQPVEFHDVALESARLQGETSERLLVRYLTALFAEQELDLVVPIGGPAVRFAQRYREQLFPDTPMLFACADMRHVQNGTLTTNDTVVGVTFSGASVLQSILQVLPETTNVAVVLGDSPVERFWLGEMERDFQSFTNRLNLVWFNQLPFTEMLKRAAKLPPRSVIFFLLLCVDADGVPSTQNRALPQLHSVANAPIFGLQDSQMGYGIVGGPLIAIGELSQNSVKVALRILRGQQPGSIKTAVQGQEQPVYDWRELRRWHINAFACRQHDSVPPANRVGIVQDPDLRRPRAFCL